MIEIMRWKEKLYIITIYFIYFAREQFLDEHNTFAGVSRENAKVLRKKRKVSLGKFLRERKIFVNANCLGGMQNFHDQTQKHWN